MPVYEYVCTACGHPVEVMHSFTALGPQACDRCGAPMRKALSTPAIVFKGSGWAKKDHRDRVHASSKAPAAVPATAGADASAGAAPTSDGGRVASEATTATAGPVAPASPVPSTASQGAPKSAD